MRYTLIEEYFETSVFQNITQLYFDTILQLSLIHILLPVITTVVGPVHVQVFHPRACKLTGVVDSRLQVVVVRRSRVLDLNVADQVQRGVCIFIFITGLIITGLGNVDRVALDLVCLLYTSRCV